MTGKHGAQDSPKDVAFYSTVAQAWVATRMEKDKTLLSLATAGIGLLATLLTTAGASSLRQLFLYGAADVADYIDTFYNRARRHSHLGGLSPEQFEAAHKPRRQRLH